MAGGGMVSYENIFIKNRHLNLISGSTKSLFLDQWKAKKTEVKIIISLPAVILGVSAQLFFMLPEKE